MIGRVRQVCLVRFSIRLLVGESPKSDCDVCQQKVDDEMWGAPPCIWFHPMMRMLMLTVEHLNQARGSTVFLLMCGDVPTSSYSRWHVPRVALIVPISSHPVTDRTKIESATSISIARPVNTAAPKSKVNDTLPKTYSYFKAHSPVRRAFHPKSAAKTNNLNEKVKTSRVNNVTTAGPKAVVNDVVGDGENAVKYQHVGFGDQQEMLLIIPLKTGSYMLKRFDYVDLQGRLKHMTGNKSFLIDYQEIDGGFVAFGGSPKGGKITGKGKIRTGKLDFEDVYFVKELKFNSFSVSQMCDKKYSVLFTETECLVLSPNFNLLDESQVLLKVPRHNNMYNFNLKNVVPLGGLTSLFAKATIDESNLWHRRFGHINFKTMNKLVRGNLVRGLPSKLFENNHTCVAFQKGKQHKASCKTKLVSSISQPLQMLKIHYQKFLDAPLLSGLSLHIQKRLVSLWDPGLTGLVRLWTSKTLRLLSGVGPLWIWGVCWLFLQTHPAKS
ncbi:ribonuclease H-like domain-containing protein [Tanacetum coccineum]